MFSIEELLLILEQYKYWVIFPVVVIEGPIITIISGFLIFLDILNPYVAFPLLLIGDLIGDSMYYGIGRFWRKSDFIKKYGRFIGYSEGSAIFLEDHFKKHTWKTLMIAKFAHGMGGTIQASSGIAHVNYGTFLLINFIGVIPKTFLLLVIGYYLGDSYQRIDGYLNIIATACIGIGVMLILYFISKKQLKGVLGKNKKLD